MPLDNSLLTIACGAIRCISSAKFPNSQANKPKTQVRRHFQLLELMVAAFILLVCIAPTMRIFVSMHLSQQEIVRQNQRDHIAHLVHAKVTKMLYKRKLHASDTKGAKTFFPLSDRKIDPLLKEFFYNCEAEMTIVDRHKPRNQEHCDKYLVKLVIKMKDISPRVKAEARDSSETLYHYMMYIDAGALDQKKERKEQEESVEEEAVIEEEDCDEDDDDDDDDLDDHSTDWDQKKKAMSPSRSVSIHQKKQVTK